MSISRKVFSLLLATTTIFTMLTGCNSGQSAESTPEQSSSANTGSEEDVAATPAEGYTLPIANGDVTIRIMCRENDSSTAPTYASGNLEVWNEIERLTGLNIEFEAVIEDDYDQVLQTRLASGKDLPDIMTVPDPVPYISKGVFEPLNDLIDQYAPDIKSVLDENTDVKASVMDSNGVVYCVPTVPKAINEIHTKILFIRQDWLDNLNLSAPVTMDDWYNVLKAFKEMDADGDGDKNNEIPMLVPSSDNFVDVRAFTAAFGLEIAYADGYSLEDGKVIYAYQTEAGREMLEFFYKCYSEGLMEARSSSDARAAFASGQVGALEDFPDTMSTNMGLLEESMPTAEVVPVAFPTTEYCPEGRSVSPYSAYGYEASAFISADSENKEAAIQLLNFLYSEEGYLLSNFGIEGKHYTMENGEPVITEYYTNNPDGLSSSDAQRNIGARHTLPYVYSREFEEQIKSLNPVIESTIPLIEKVSAPPSMPSLMPTEEEASRLKTLSSDFDTYVAENVSNLVLGNMSFDKYDEFLNGLEGMGLSEILAIKQTQYDRFLENQK